MSLLDQSVFDGLIREANKTKSYSVSNTSSTGPITSSAAELEFRFRPFPPRTTHLPVVHERIYNFMKKKISENLFETITDVVELYDNDVRKILTTDFNPLYQRKIKIEEYENKSYALKATVSREDNLVTTFALPKSAKPKLVRKRERTRIPYEGVFLDLTRVSVGDERRFEIEIELPNFDIPYEVVVRILRLIFRVYRMTNVIYDISIYQMVAKFFNETLSIEAKASMQTGEFYDNVLSRTRGLKMQDLVYGGIIGPKHQYSVTPKADGERAIIMFHYTGLWAYIPSGTLVCIIMSNKFSALHGTILDCEYIPPENRTVVKDRVYGFVFTVFDCLALASNFSTGSTLVQDEDHMTRMQAAQVNLDQVSDILAAHRNLVVIRTKKFCYFNSAEQFFDAMTRVSSLQLPYKTDGYVFTPRNTRAIPYAMIHTIPLTKRNLSDYPDIVKWKPSDKLTIDFIVDVEGHRLLSNSRGSLVPFAFRDFDAEDNVAWQEFEEMNVTKDIVWECNWKDNMFHPYRDRYDKAKPNNLEVAIDNFKELLRGISFDTLLGRTDALLRSYHNRVKSDLYDIAITRHAGPTILDLGSGRGGDLSKWKAVKVKKVYAVEPDINNIDEFYKRLADIKVNCEVINCGAEDTQEIANHLLDDKVDIITSMLSGSFFWKDDEMLGKVAGTIKEFSKKGSLFIIFTINGQLMDEIIEPTMREGVPFLSPMKLGVYTFDFHEDSRPKDVTEQTTGKRYSVSIPGSIVGENQIEYKVYLDLLTKLLTPEFELVTHQIADEEQFLPAPYIIVTKMYSFAIYERVIN